MACRDADKKFSINQGGGFPSPELARAFKPCGRGGGRGGFGRVRGEHSATTPAARSEERDALCQKMHDSRHKKYWGISLFSLNAPSTLADKNKGQRRVHSHTHSHTRCVP